MLTDLRLFQFKKFKDESIELFPLTLLTGINGMGKSSVIQALLVLRQSFDRGELQNNKNLVIEDKELTNLISPDDMLNADAESTDVSITLEDDNVGSATWKVKVEGKSNTLPLIDNVSNDSYAMSLFSKTFQYLKAERIGPRATYDRLTVTRPHSPIGYSGEFVANRILEAANQLEEVQLDKIKIEGQSKVYDLLSHWMSF